jgi:hypothetical protein
MVEKSMPSRCPSCEQALEVVRLRCGGCSTAVEGTFPLPPLARLGADEQAFVLRFLKASGSLKEVARQYGISYPTVRNRLDGLIERIGRIEAEAAKEGEGR